MTKTKTKTKTENEVLKGAYFCLQKIGLLCNLLEVVSIKMFLIEGEKQCVKNQTKKSNHSPNTCRELNVYSNPIAGQKV